MDTGKTTSYGAIIRAYEVSPQLRELVEQLRRQTLPPAEIIIVDSSRCADTALAFREMETTVVEYPDEPFNFSKAINLGIAANRHENSLIISSHIDLRGDDIVAEGLRAAAAENVEVISYIHAWPVKPNERTFTVSPRQFNGRNGLSNSMAMLPTRLVAERPFREEVFSAEDQEWAKYYFERFGRPTLRVETLKVGYLNPNHGGDKWSHAKLMNETLAIGHFVRRRLIYPDVILVRAARGVLATIRLRPDRAKMHFAFAWAMLKANFVQPTGQSRYF